jgi:uncharacterized protein YggE
MATVRGMDASDRVIVVVGEGAAVGTADQCDLSLGLGVFAPTAAEAIDQVTKVVSAALVAVREAGVRAEDTQTQNLTVQEWFDQKEQKTTAYVGRYGLTITGQAVDRVGALIAAVAGVARDALRVDGLRLRLSDVDPLRRLARRRAVEDARQQAAELAEAAGVGLGPLLSIEHGASVFPIGFARSESMAFSAGINRSVAPPPIEAGSSRIVAHVTMRFQIQD